MKYLLVLVLATASFVLFPERAQAAVCEANYRLANSPVTTGWIRLADVTPVGFPPSAAAPCRDQALARCQVTRNALNQYAPVGSPNFNMICSNSGVTVTIDVRVDGMISSTGASCKAPVACAQKPCPAWDNYMSP